MTSGKLVSQLHSILILMFQVRVYSFCGSGTADILCAKAELRCFEDKTLVWKRNCGTSSRSILCGSGTTEFPSIIPCAEAEFQTLKSHNILCAEADCGA